MDRLLEVDHLHRHFGPLHAVRDVSFDLRPGEVLGFLGPNGAGKSTTMQIISGNLGPSAGRVRLHGIDLLDDPRAAKRHLGYLPDSPPLYLELTVNEFLRHCARLHGLRRQPLTAAVNSARERCGLTDAGRRLIGNLSKGYRQRVGIAQAILHSPAVVVLDEPTVGLDPNQIREMRELIRELGRDHGVILSTHMLAEVQAVCDRVQIIHRGRLVLEEAISGLDQHAPRPSILIRLDRPPDRPILENIPGVESLEVLPDGAVRLFPAEDADPAPQLVEQSVRHNWGLRELRPEHHSLEDIFARLTGEEEMIPQLNEVAA